MKRFSFRDRIRRGRALVKASRAVIAMNPGLMAYYWLRTFAGLVTIAILMVPVIVAPRFFHLESQTMPWQYLLVLIPGMLIGLTGATYVQVAQFAAADAALRGEKMGLKEGFRFANRRLWRCFQWAVIAAGVGFFVSQIQERFGWAGRILGFASNFTWAVASALAIPSLAFHDLGPISALKTSTGLIRKRWGEMVVGSSIIFGLSLLVSLLLIGIFMGVSFLGHWTIDAFFGQSIAPHVIFLLVTLIALLAGLLYYGTLYSTAEAIFQAALYRYAETGDYVGPFPQEVMAEYYLPRKSLKFWKRK